MGRIVVTTLNGGGESLTPSDMGLENFDYLQLTVEEAVGGASGQHQTAAWSFAAQEFYVFQGGSTTNTSGKSFSIMFSAEGNSNRAPQFL